LAGQQPASLVFDLDGTLLDVSVRHHHVYSAVCTALGGRPLERAEYWQLKRQGVAWADILAPSGLTPDEFTTFDTRFREQIELPENLGFDTLFPTAIPLLTRVAGHHCVLASLRSSATALRAQLDVLEMQPFFAATDSAFPDGEPASVVKARLIRKLMPTETRAAVIGDTEADVAAAVELGYVSIALCSGIRDRSVLVHSKPDHLVDDLSGVEGALRQAGML
jgi:phosphoglycolate phosphatase-like HAD superfamily hydrolase